jgi:hypothetical protein
MPTSTMDLKPLRRSREAGALPVLFPRCVAGVGEAGVAVSQDGRGHTADARQSKAVVARTVNPGRAQASPGAWHRVRRR